MQDNVKLSAFDKFEDNVKDYLKNLDDLRKDGTDKVKNLTQEIKRIKGKKNIDSATKSAQIQQLQTDIQTAKTVANGNKEKVKSAVSQSVKYINDNYPAFYNEAKQTAKEKKAQAKSEYLAQKASISNQYQKDIENLKNSEKDPSRLKSKLNILKREKKQNDFENKKLYQETVQKAKDEQHASYMYRNDLLYSVRDGKQSFTEKISSYFENYIYKFNIKDFLMKNGLYIIIAIFMIVCIIKEPYLISSSSIWLILKNFSTKVFFALGVAGLILLAGTDLSVGRMVTLSTMITCMILNPNTTVTFFGLSLTGIYSSLGFAGALVVALLLSALMCVIFSTIAGLFTAKFKIHPFISTLGTSLIIWGLIGFGTNNIKTGTISDEALAIAGNIGPVPLTLIYAIVAIVIVWFIWNKTVFGKNMYAVGGNAEAASVSGISVFKVTLGVFIMAGILYGIGGFFQATVSGSSSSSFGQGWELEAIAACVIGGISFTGGIGKISGAVFGCLLFEIMKYYLRGVFSGSADISNIFIGIIILAAVTFDSIKYLKKK